MSDVKKLIELEHSRYAELIAKETRLQVLENAIRSLEKYDPVEPLQRLFGLEKER